MQGKVEERVQACKVFRKSARSGVLCNDRPVCCAYRVEGVLMKDDVPCEIGKYHQRCGNQENSNLSKAAFPPDDEKTCKGNRRQARVLGACRQTSEDTGKAKPSIESNIVVNVFQRSTKRQGGKELESGPHHVDTGRCDARSHQSHA